ncbi:MAG: sigma-54 dependent transcriptional regulator [bacterium]|nr:sigma-54 dependent transcriptional regulator [bacterium]
MKDESTILEIKKRLKERLGLRQFLGNSTAFREVVRGLAQLSRCDVTVLLIGETGTGKDLCARALHYLGSRSAGPFIPVNCGAIPDTLFESEMFGHHKGAFTGAVASGAGMVKAAEGGTLFLDEIETLSLLNQGKMLRFLQEKEFRALGSSRIIQADVRLIAATNADLKQKMAEGSLRKDLYYRLHVGYLHLPPLRERKEDIPILSDYFLEVYSRQYNRATPSLSQEAVLKLLAYDWPGNVRELENIIQQVVVRSSGSILSEQEIDIPDPSGNGRKKSFREARTSIIKEFEQSYISKVLVINNGNISQAAREADIDRSAFRRLMKKHQIQTAPQASST